ncbi:MAG TPA: hypothetical protein DEP19_09555 [Anaerolineae bacterium]|nr:hypothetical protein [Anaerolineae bacterium]HCK65289.1 hypothetical protein [Anaerolineae bacterium]
MKSKWIEYKGKKIFYQDFSNNFFNDKAVIAELKEVQELILTQPENSTLVLSNFSNTEITSAVMPLLNESSKKTKSHIRKTAVVGVSGIKRTLGDLLSKITGQSLMYFNDENEAKDWLAQD